jgi:glycosyltransferase involved in cell wall biosynthesis
MAWACTMIGAREHYCLPRALQSRNSLFRLYTDAWAGHWQQLLHFGKFRSLAGRYHAEISSELVVSYTGHALKRRLINGLFGKSGTRQYDEYVDEGRHFAQSVNRSLDRVWQRESPTGLIAYTTGCLETAALFRDRGLPVIVDQIDAAQFHEQVVLVEQSKWPDWRLSQEKVPESYWDRLKAEWELADRVIVNSDWSRRALVEQGVSPEKLVVVPLAYETKCIKQREYSHEGELVVLYLGRVVLEKGIPYLFDAARQLLHQSVRFVIAGPIDITPTALKAAPPNVTILGPVTRDRIGELYSAAHLFVLPTMSDGFAITQIEAMVHGLPVIATPNCGNVVSHGEDGWIVPAGDSIAIAARIEEALANRRRLADMSRNAAETAKQYSVANYAQHISRLLEQTKSSVC